MQKELCTYTLRAAPRVPSNGVGISTRKGIGVAPNQAGINYSSEKGRSQRPARPGVLRQAPTVCRQYEAAWAACKASQRPVSGFKERVYAGKYEALCSLALTSGLSHSRGACNMHELPLSGSPAIHTPSPSACACARASVLLLYSSASSNTPACLPPVVSHLLSLSTPDFHCSSTHPAAPVSLSAIPSLFTPAAAIPWSLIPLHFLPPFGSSAQAPARDLTSLIFAPSGPFGPFWTFRTPFRFLDNHSETPPKPPGSVYRHPRGTLGFLAAHPCHSKSACTDYSPRSRPPLLKRPKCRLPPLPASTSSRPATSK